MDVLVSETAYERFADLLVPAAPAARWWRLDGGGDLRADDADGARPAGAPEVRPEVAWLSNDLFRAGGPMAAFLDLLRAPSMRWLQSAASGVEAPIFGEVVANGVLLTNSHVNAVPIAEYVVGAVLRHYQRPDLWAEAQAVGAWRHHDFREVYGTTWLVVGVGAIGREVAARARAFGARVVGVRRAPQGTEPVDRMIGPGGVAAALADADVVVLALPGGAATRHLVDDAFLGAMRAGSVLVNVARGTLVDDAALVAALDRGVPGHAVLDVFAVEPLPPSSPLWHHPAVTVTPHAASGGVGRYRRAAEVFAGNLRRYVAGVPLVDVVDPAVVAVGTGADGEGWYAAGTAG